MKYFLLISMVILFSNLDGGVKLKDVVKDVAKYKVEKEEERVHRKTGVSLDFHPDELDKDKKKHPPELQKRIDQLKKEFNEQKKLLRKKFKENRKILIDEFYTNKKKNKKRRKK